MALGSVRPQSERDDRPQALRRAGRGPWRSARRRRRVPFVALGGLLVIVCVLTFAYGAVQVGDRLQVLVVARAVAAGQVITAANLTTVSAAKDSTVDLVAASQGSQVVGRTAVVPLLPGTLLTPALVGDAAFPPAGKVTASIAVKPGQYPQGLASGAQVVVFVAADPVGEAATTGSATRLATAAEPPSRLEAVVLGVDLAGDGQGATVITLLLAESDGARLAAAPAGGVVLMQTSPREG